MTIMIKTEIIGLKELMRAVAKLGDEAMPLIKIASDTSAGLVLNRAQSIVAVDHGNLKQNLRVSKRKLRSGKLSVFSYVTFSKKTAHGVPLELGHRLVINGNEVGTVKERPFLRPSADQSKDEVASMITKAMDQALKQMGGRKA